MIDVQALTALRADFPILNRKINGKRLVYLDSTASSQKPEAVLKAMDAYYRNSHANIHRGVYQLSEEATAAYDGARERVAAFLNTRSSRELIFVRNTTEAINLVAYTWGRANIHRGDVILLSEMEHHSNLVPWQMLARETGAVLEFLEVSKEGLLDLGQLDLLLEQRPKLVALTHMSNALGTINPVKEIAARAHAVGAVVLIDGAQSVPHLGVDVQDIDCDFLAFSGHKMLGPTGIGGLYGKRALLEEMPPFMGGGDMIGQVSLREFTWGELPCKFEAGTPAIAEGVGLGAAVDYLTTIGMATVRRHEQEITAYAMREIAKVPDLTIYGPPAEQRGGVVAFTLADIHPHDLASILDREGIAIRAGHHCTMPLHEKLGLTATARASFYVYNTNEDVDALVAALYEARRIFRV